MSDDDKIIRFPTFERIEDLAGEMSVSAVITRADGTVEDKGVLSSAFEKLGAGWYKLVNRTPVPVDYRAFNDELVARFTLSATGDDPWRVAETLIGSNVRISTVFLGFSHPLFGGPPLLFETMIFGGRLSDFQSRCSTWEQAEAMHNEAVELVRHGHLKVIK